MSNLSTLLDRYKALVVFDTETSGLDFDNDQIIELATLRVERTATGGLRIASKMDTFIKLPEGATLPENIRSANGSRPFLMATHRQSARRKDTAGSGMAGRLRSSSTSSQEP